MSSQSIGRSGFHFLPYCSRESGIYYTQRLSLIQYFISAERFGVSLYKGCTGVINVINFKIITCQNGPFFTPQNHHLISIKILSNKIDLPEHLDSVTVITTSCAICFSQCGGVKVYTSDGKHIIAQTGYPRFLVHIQNYCFCSEFCILCSAV